MTSLHAGSRRHLSSSPFKREPEPEPEVYQVGDRVDHGAFGLGRVIGTQEEFAVSVDFGRQTERVRLPCKNMSRL